MTRLIYAVYDSKAEAFLQPFFVQARGVATRMFQTACQDAGHDFHKYAEDYTLFELGTFDEENGKFLTYDSPKSIVMGIVIRDAKKEQ